MKTSVISALVAALLVFCAACSKNRNDPESVRRQWEREGWTYVETFGPTVPDAVVMFHVSGESAKEVTAGITVGGIRKEKKYTQGNDVYMVVGFISPKTGDGFDMIFKRLGE